MAKALSSHRCFQRDLNLLLDLVKKVFFSGPDKICFSHQEGLYFDNYGATQIVDLFHAREHYWNVAKACFGQNKDKLYQWTEERRKELDDGRPEEVINAINRCSSLPKIHHQHFMIIEFTVEIVIFYLHQGESKSAANSRLFKV